MKIKESKLHNGETRYIVDGKINGNRRREQFDTKRECGTSWLKYQTEGTPPVRRMVGCRDPSNAERVDIMAAFNRAKEDGFSLLCGCSRLMQFSGRGNTHLKKCTLGEAVGSAYVDDSAQAGFTEKQASRDDPKMRSNRAVSWAQNSGKGCRRNTLFTLKSLTHNFRDYIGADVDVTHISPEMVESWLDAGRRQGSMEAGKIRPKKGTTDRSRICSTG